MEIQLLTYRVGGRKGSRVRGRRRHRNTGRRIRGGRHKGGNYILSRGQSSKKCARIDRSDTEMHTEGGGEAGTCESQPRHKKGHMTNIHLTDLDEEAIVDIVKAHEELYDKTNEHFKDKVRKECLWVRFANSCKLFVIVCKTWFHSQRTRYMSSSLARLQKK